VASFIRENPGAGKYGRLRI
jgi:D-arabinitol 2-dehydrogenase